MMNADLPPASAAASRAAYHDPSPFSMDAAGHSFSFYPGGADRLTALIELIDQARQSLQVCYYLFDDDASGTAVRDALIAAAQRGVAVELIVDDFGNDAGRSFFKPLVEEGGWFAVFSPQLGRRYFVRNHQKLVIADGLRVMTGGANVSDHYFNPPEKNGWCDLSVVIEGPVVGKFTEWFGLLRGWVEDETEGCPRNLRALRDIVKDWDGGEGPVQLLVGGPLVRRGHWVWQLRKDMERARRFDSVSAYFSPPRTLRRQIAQVARRGKVRMIMAGKSDIDAAIDMARLLYKHLLSAGVRIFEFQPCKLHMKLLVADNASYVGSANLDKRSFRINVELMVRIEDAALAAKLREMIDHLQDASEPVTREWYAQQASFLARMRWRMAYWMSLADYRISQTGTG